MFRSVVLWSLFLLLVNQQAGAYTGAVNLRRACVSPNKDITLYWVSDTDACNSFIQYKIWGRKTAADPWEVVDSVGQLSQTTYTHVGAAVSGTSWQYKIVVENNCNGLPGPDSDSISVDLVAPAASDPDSVSVDPFSGKIVVGWKKNPASDLAGYSVYQQSGAVTSNIGNTADTFLTISGFNTADSAYTFKIAAFDSCGNLSPSISTHSTMLLKGNLDECAGIYNLSWTAYEGWPGIQKYDIWVSRNLGPWNPEKNVDGSTLAATVDNILPGDMIQVFVRAYSAIDNAISSSSNLLQDSIALVKIPKVNYLSLVSIKDNKSVVINWISDTSGEISFFRLKRGKDILNMQTLADIQFDKNSAYYAYEDRDEKAGFDKTIYYYQIEVFDNCRNSTGSLSNISNTIIANVVVVNDTQNMVVWNKYSYFSNEVGYYYVYRGLEFDGVYDWQVIGSSKSSDTTFFDATPPSEVGNTGICYKVTAFENPGNTLTLSQMQSNSSYSCELKDFKIFFPTAFNPFGVNRKWVPRGSYINYDKSEVKIFNRWGQYITTIEDMHKGWDGKDANGNWMAPGPYIYYAIVTGVNKRKQTFTGDFYLLR